MSTTLKQHAATEFLSGENVTPAEIHRHLEGVYGEDTVNRTTVNRWAIKFRECEPGRANIVDQPRCGRPVSVTDDKHQKQFDELIKHDRRITQKQTAGKLGMSKKWTISLVYLATQKSVLHGCRACWRRKRNKNVLKFVKNFWSAIAKREMNFF